MPEITALIVDDEPLVAIFIKRVLLKRGATVLDIVYDGEKALHAICSYKPDVIFMDINIKGALDGISVIQKAAVPKETSIFYISAYNSLEIIEEAMQTNPRNYLIKPIREENIIIALSIVKNSMQANSQKKKNEHSIILGDKLVYDMASQQIFLDNKKIALTHNESKIINLLVANINQKVSYEAIKEIVWDGKEIADSTLRDAVSTLRQKVSVLDVENCYGEGYKLLSPSEERS